MESLELAPHLAELRKLRFGYIPYRPGCGSPGDRRRFPRVAHELQLNWEEFRQGQSYDVVYATSNADLSWFHRQASNGKRYVFEMVDSYLDVPLWEPKALLRGAGKWLTKKHRYFELNYGQSIRKSASRADLVMCGTPEQAQQLAPFNPNAHHVLDFHDELLGTPRTVPRDPDRFHIFWEGLALSASQFSLIGETLQKLNRERKLCLHLLTDATYKPLNLPLLQASTRKMMTKLLGSIDFTISEWHPRTVQAIASHCDLGLIPLDLSKPLYRAKPENKLLIMWRLGLPVVTSATPSYSRVMRDYGGPYWACGNEQWDSILLEALESEPKRQASLKAGQDYVENRMGTANLLNKWLGALSTLLS